MTINSTDDNFDRVFSPLSEGGGTKKKLAFFLLSGDSVFFLVGHDLSTSILESLLICVEYNFCGLSYLFQNNILGLCTLLF